MPQNYGIAPQQTYGACMENEKTYDRREQPAIRADDVRSAKHFDEGAHKYAAGYEERCSAGHSFRARRSKAQALLGKGPLGDLLDVGGASGVYFDALKSQVSSYHILDVSPLMISQAQDIKSGGVPLFCHLASAYNLPFPDEHFDTVLAMGVLEYLDQPWKALEEMARVARPGGVILVSYPNVQSPMRRMSQAIYRFFRKPSPFAATLVFSVGEVREAAATLKLKEICIKGYNAQLIPFPLTWRLRWLSYYLAKALEPLLGRSGNLWGSSFIVKCEKLNGNGWACTARHLMKS
jgi:ubiquinone/menaquinone biosynthesis C-methylase UbiE